MRLLFLLASFCLGLARLGCGQAYQHFSLNAGVQATRPAELAVLAVWDAYLGASAADKPQFWAASERARYPQGDLLLSEGYVRPNVYALNTQKVVLSLARKTDSLYQCQTQFYWQTGPDSARQLQVLSIVVVYFQRTANKWFLVNNLSYHTRQWTTRTVGHLTYWLPPGYPFNAQRASGAARFLDELFRDFGIAPLQVTYYLAPDCDTLLRLKGFAYVLGTGSSPVCGFYDEVNHLVYAGGQGEAYLHELAHIINPYFPRAHELFLAGFAGWRGGHYGHDLAYHKARVRAYLATHPVDLTQPLAFHTLDADTNPQYVLGGIFCELAMQQGGLPKLKALLSYGPSDADFYQALKQELHLRPADLPAVIQQQLAKP